MKTERRKMLGGELYNPMDLELVAGRTRAGDLCQVLNVTREAETDEWRRILSELFGPAVKDRAAAAFRSSIRERDTSLLRN